MSGDPDVLEYYKNDHSKKPIRVIDLQCCEQVDAGLTFKRKEFQDSYVFDIKTVDRTFYLVAETEEEMNKWVRSICHLCGFNQSDESHGREQKHSCSSISLGFCLSFFYPLFKIFNSLKEISANFTLYFHVLSFGLAKTINFPLVCYLVCLEFKFSKNLLQTKITKKQLT